MKKRFLALALLSGIALAQTGSNGVNSQNPQNGQPNTSGLPTSEQTLRGCLRQAGNGWTISQSGQETVLSGDSAMMNPHNGQQVEIQGTQPIGGAVQVTSVTTIANACIGQSSTPATTPSSTPTAVQIPAKSTSNNSTSGSKGNSSQTPGTSDQPGTPPAQSTPPSGSPGSQPPAKPPMND